MIINLRGAGITAASSAGRSAAEQISGTYEGCWGSRSRQKGARTAGWAARGLGGWRVCLRTDTKVFETIRGTVSTISTRLSPSGISGSGTTITPPSRLRCRATSDLAGVPARRGVGAFSEHGAGARMRFPPAPCREASPRPPSPAPPWPLARGTRWSLTWECVARLPCRKWLSSTEGARPNSPAVGGVGWALRRSSGDDGAPAELSAGRS